jgi:hypothetical protein
MTLWTIISVLALIAGAAGVRRVRQARAHKDHDSVTDDMIRQIEERGSVDVEEEEPLDFETIEEEEARFWEETWDEPEEP